MADAKSCPKCGAQLPDDAPAGMCPKCLMQAAFESQVSAVSDPDRTNLYQHSDSAAATTVPPAAGRAPRFPAPYLEELARQFPQLDSLEHLGQGGMGVVYKARQRQLDRWVAVKILPPSIGNDPAFAERFTREAQALAKLNHANIVQVYDFGQTDEYFYFIMEFVDGMNLRTLIREGTLKPEEALKIVPQICEALQFAHDEGIVHRDIKPENILIDKRGRIKIADFGLAKLLGEPSDGSSLTGTGQLMGTLGYMAPEQLQQAHSVDHRADIYSLGVVFYEMLTGKLPMGRFDPPSKRVQVDVRLDDVVLRTLESEPDRRYQHASDVKTEVESITFNSKAAATHVPASSTDEARRDEELAGRAPLWLDFGAIGIFIAGWVLLGAMWNLRQFGMTLAISAFALLTYLVVCWKLKYLPQLSAEISRQSKIRRGLMLALAFGIFVFAIFAAIGAHLSLWNAVHAIPQVVALSELPVVAQGEDAFAKFPLEKLKAFESQHDADIEVTTSGGIFMGMTDWRSAAWYFFVATMLVVLAVQTVIDTRRYRNTWKFYWGPSIATAALMSVSLLLAHFVRSVHYDKDFPLISESSGTFGVREIHDPKSSTQIESAIDQWADANQYAGRQERSWILRKGKDNVIGKIHKVELRPIAPYDAWRIAFGGPAWRPLPPMNITWLALNEPPDAVVLVDMGFITRQTNEESTWPRVLESLERAIHSGSPVQGSVAFDEGTMLVIWPLTLVILAGMAVVSIILLRQRRYSNTVASHGAHVRRFERSPIHQASSRDVGRPVTKKESDSQVETCATWLFVVGWLSVSATLVIWLSFAVYPFFKIMLNRQNDSIAVRSSELEQSETRALAISATLSSWYGIVAYPLAVIVILGAMSMQRFHSRWLSIMGSAVAVVPWTPAWLLGLPVGVWSLVVLNRPDTEFAFRDKTIDRESLATSIRRLATALFYVGVIGFASVAWIPFAATADWYNRRSGPVPVHFMPIIPALCLFALCSLILPLVARKMRKRTSFRWSIVASVLALLPLNFAWPVTFPIGLWLLATLTRGDARQAFARQEDTSVRFMRTPRQ